MPNYLFMRKHRRGLLAVFGLVLLSAAGGAILLSNGPLQNNHPASPATSMSGPPWRYGPDGARFTLVAYADLECPYCQAYIPKLMKWVKANPEVLLQWHHLPLPVHEPAASYEARLAECLGDAGGARSFWEAVDWIYANTRGNGHGMNDSSGLPGMSAAVDTCMKNERVAELIRTQVKEAIAEGITATPTLRLLDRETGRTLKLEGGVDEAILLSALDWLSSTPDSFAAEALPSRMQILGH